MEFEPAASVGSSDLFDSLSKGAKDTDFRSHAFSCFLKRAVVEGVKDPMRGKIYPPVYPFSTQKPAIQKTRLISIETGERNQTVLLNPLKQGIYAKKAERAGFEPAVNLSTHADLANRCFRPLSHLSGNGNL